MLVFCLTTFIVLLLGALALLSTTHKKHPKREDAPSYLKLSFDGGQWFRKNFSTLFISMKRLANFHGLDLVNHQGPTIASTFRPPNFKGIFKEGHFPKIPLQKLEDIRKKDEEIKKLVEKEGFISFYIKGYEFIFAERDGKHACLSISLVIRPTDTSKGIFPPTAHITLWASGKNAVLGLITRHAKQAQDKDRSVLCPSIFVEYNDFYEEKEVRLTGNFPITYLSRRH